MNKYMSKEEFKKKWESSEDFGGITMNDIANCAIAWGITQKPRIMRIDMVQYMVLKAAGISDAAEYLEVQDEC